MNKEKQQQQQKLNLEYYIEMLVGHDKWQEQRDKIAKEDVTVITLTKPTSHLLHKIKINNKNGQIKINGKTLQGQNSDLTSYFKTPINIQREEEINTLLQDFLNEKEQNQEKEEELKQLIGEKNMEIIKNKKNSQNHTRSRISRLKYYTVKGEGNNEYTIRPTQIIYDQYEEKFQVNTIMNELGRGAFGTVKNTGNKIARKAFKGDYNMEDTMKEFQSHEMVYEKMKEIGKEKYIPKIYDMQHYLKAKSIINIEKINGITLKEWLREERGLNEKQKVLEQLVDLGESLKKCELIHGDIKPQNIMINSNNEIKLIDFGGAKDITKKIKKRQQSTGENNLPLKISWHYTTSYSPKNINDSFKQPNFSLNLEEVENADAFALLITACQVINNKNKVNQYHNALSTLEKDYQIQPRDRLNILKALAGKKIDEQSKKHKQSSIQSKQQKPDQQTPFTLIEEIQQIKTIADDNINNTNQQNDSPNDKFQALSELMLNHKAPWIEIKNYIQAINQSTTDETQKKKAIAGYVRYTKQEIYDPLATKILQKLKATNGVKTTNNLEDQTKYAEEIVYHSEFIFKFMMALMKEPQLINNPKNIINNLSAKGVEVFQQNKSELIQKLKEEEKKIILNIQQKKEEEAKEKEAIAEVAQQMLKVNKDTQKKEEIQNFIVKQSTDIWKLAEIAALDEGPLKLARTPSLKALIKNETFKARYHEVLEKLGIKPHKELTPRFRIVRLIAKYEGNTSKISQLMTEEKNKQRQYPSNYDLLLAISTKTKYKDEEFQGKKAFTR